MNYLSLFPRIFGLVCIAILLPLVTGTGGVNFFFLALSTPAIFPKCIYFDSSAADGVQVLRLTRVGGGFVLYSPPAVAVHLLVIVFFTRP